MELRPDEHPAPPLLVTLEYAAIHSVDPVRARFEQEYSRWTGVDLAYAQWIAASLAFRTRDFPTIQRVFTEGIERSRTHERWSLASRMAQQLAYLCIEDRDFACGRQWLEQDASLLPFPTSSHLYYQGLLAHNRGDLGEAAVAYREALLQTRALGSSPALELALAAQSTLLMAQLGDLRGAREAMTSGLQLAQSMPRPSHAGFLNTAAWSVLVSGHADWSPRPLRALLEHALDLLGKKPQGRDAWFSVRLNLAQDSLERGEVDDARRWLDEVSAHSLSRHDERWHQVLLARLERLEGALEPARRRLEALIEDAAQHREHGVQWTARIDRARVLEEQDHVAAALAEYAAADQLIEQWLPLLSLSSWDRFAAARDRGTRRRIALLTATGDDRAALCVARVTRTRSLRTIRDRLRRDADPQSRRAFDEYLGTKLRLDAEYDETFLASGPEARRRQQEIDQDRTRNEERFEALMRERGQDPAAEPDCASLSTPPDGTVDLHYARLDRAWVGWSMDARGQVTRAELGDLAEPLRTGNSDALGQALLAPFGDALGDARRVRVMATAELHEVPFHTLPLGDDGRRLQDHAVVVHGLDLPQGNRTGVQTGPALVLEPTSNLASAHQEAQVSASGLRSRGATVERLEGSAPSDGTLLIERALQTLPRASWLHYVGHARADDSSGWTSELVLAADGSMALGVSQILALPAVPRAVVLSGCETGVVDPASAGGGMSLAHAFVLAGAEVVVATTEEVRDDQVIALMDDLYGSLSGLDAPAVEAALQTAQQRAAARPDGGATRSAWQLVRAWVP